MSRDNSQIGEALLPPEPGDVAESLLATCDPALSALAAAFQTVLNAKLNTAWQAAAVSFGAEFGGNTVNEVHVLGAPELIEQSRATWKWPALMLWRLKDTYRPRTLSYDECESEVVCVYVLPPLTLEFAQRLGHIRKAVVNTLHALIEEQSDVSLLDGDNFLEAAGVEELRLVDATYGSVFRSADLQRDHLGVEMTLALKEREMPTTTGAGTATDIRSTVDLVDTTTLSGVLETKVDPSTV